LVVYVGLEGSCVCAPEIPFYGYSMLDLLADTAMSDIELDILNQLVIRIIRNDNLSLDRARNEENILSKHNYRPL